MRCKKISEEELSLDIQQKLWNETIKNNIFIICKTPMAKQITQRTLAGYSTIKTNAHYFDDLVNQLKNKAPQFIERILNSSYWKKGESGKMKFDAIVGNPPYQEENSNTRKPPLYHYFYDMAFKLSDIVTLITPARFLFNIGQTPKSWNEKMLNDEHFKVINYFSDSKSIFDTVDIKGGVVITLHNTKENYGKIKVFTPFKELN